VATICDYQDLAGYWRDAPARGAFSDPAAEQRRDEGRPLAEQLLAGERREGPIERRLRRPDGRVIRVSDDFRRLNAAVEPALFRSMRIASTANGVTVRAVLPWVHGAER
jgi:hypothetical protein